MNKKHLKFVALLLSATFIVSCALTYTKKEENNTFKETTTEQAEQNKKTITEFYEAFKNHDSNKMISLYHDEIEFEDPAFGKLKGIRAKAMWQMLVERGKDTLKVSFDNVKANDNYGTAEWKADYLFSTTNRMVHNEIKANFEFKNGKIFRHKDDFDLWKWSSQALGFLGSTLGFTPFFKSKFNEESNKLLTEYINKTKS
ncbi:MAG: nuclear transport factor 2 family protein [Candidatus Sericytochromatia bacterium]